MFLRIILITVCLLLQLLLAMETSCAQPQREELVGGQFVDLTSRPIALLIATNGFCSGALVGPREVLTAAHCLKGVSTFTVWVGNEVYESVDMSAHPEYRSDMEPLEAAPVDMALVFLDRAVTNIEPLPILENKPLQVDQTFSAYGFGANEYSNEYQSINDFYTSGKTGSFQIWKLGHGTFESIMRESVPTTLCPGDSGAPATISIANREVVVGVASYGTAHTDSARRCNPLSFEISGFLDLQSKRSRQFLSNFPTLARYMHTPNPSEQPTAPADQPTSDLTQVIPQAPIVAATGGLLSVQMSPLSNVQYVVKLRGRKAPSRRGRQSRVVTKLFTSLHPTKILRVSASLRRAAISYYYQSVDGTMTRSKESARVVVRTQS